MKFPYNREAAARLLSNEETFGFVLVAIILSAYGTEALEEEDLTCLFTDLEGDFDCKLCEENENKINAAITAMTTDLFYTNPNVFDAVTLALNEGDIGDIVSGIMEEVNAPQALWALYEVALLNADSMEESRNLCSQSVINHVNEIITGEAADLDEVDDETDTLEEAIQEPYYQQYVNAKIRELARQLLFLGCDPSSVNEFLAENRLTLDDDEQQEA